MPKVEFWISKEQAEMLIEELQVALEGLKHNLKKGCYLDRISVSNRIGALQSLLRGTKDALSKKSQIYQQS